MVARPDVAVSEPEHQRTVTLDAREEGGLIPLPKPPEERGVGIDGRREGDGFGHGVSICEARTSRLHPLGKSPG